MYFWKYKKLVDDFIENKITEKQKMAYVFIPTLLTFIGMVLKLSLPSLDIKNNPAWTTLSDSVMVSITAIETFFIMAIMLVAYKLNRNADNKDLISRYFAFKFISMVRTVVFLPGFLILYVLLKGFQNGSVEANAYEIMMIFALAAFYSYYVQIMAFLYLNKSYHSDKEQIKKNLNKSVAGKSVKTVKKVITKKQVASIKNSKNKIDKNTKTKKRG